MTGILRKLFGRKRKVNDLSAPRSITQIEELKLEEAERLTVIINDSMQLFKESKNLETRMSRLYLAKEMVGKLRNITTEYPFINAEELEKLEYQISDLFQEQMPEMRRVSQGNMEGDALEKEGKTEEAIEIYEALATSGTDTPYTYRRLAILYRKKKEPARELHFIEMALNNIPRSNEKHYAWFKERLAKLK